MSDAKYVNIARLMMSHNFEIEDLPDNLKCVQCKSVLKDARQIPCGCTYCRVCIDAMMADQIEFCLGNSDYCAGTQLSTCCADYGTNRTISRLTVKCPNNGCSDACQLANMEEHLRECPKRKVECPFREFGCTLDTFEAEKIDGHLQLENRRHGELLIGMVANNNREIEASRREIELLKHELKISNETIQAIRDQIFHVTNENISITNDLVLIKQENADLADRVRILSEQIENEVNERHENDELDSARLIEHVDREMIAMTRVIDSKELDMATEAMAIRNVIRSMNHFVRSINDDICSTKCQVQSIQAVVGLAEIDARYEWVIDDDVQKSRWWWGERSTEYFQGMKYPYIYRLVSGNSENTQGGGVLQIDLQFHAGPSDSQLEWPFDGRVVITVTGRGRRGASRSVCRQCKIDRPQRRIYSCSDSFEFSHRDLVGAGLSLSHGVQISCSVVPEPKL